MEGVLIKHGMRWRDVGPVHHWADVIAVLECEPYDSPISKAMKPDEWYWHDPAFLVLNEVRNHLRQINFKTAVEKEHKSDVPDPVLPPWVEADKKKTVSIAPEPSTKDEIRAHLERLNGKR